MDALRVASAFPDPPFEVPGPTPTGLDLDLMTAVAGRLGRRLVTHRYAGADFDGIFGDLGRYADVVASGATVTDHRRTLARWCRPYLRSGQSLVVAGAAFRGGTLGVQHGNTSEPVARAWLAAGTVAGVKVYAYDAILDALADVEHGVIDGFMKLEPVLRWLVADRPGLRIARTGITTEYIAVAVGRDSALADPIDGALDAMRRDGTLAALGRRWLADSDPAATEMLT